MGIFEFPRSLVAPLGGRFLLVGCLPLGAGVLFVLVLLWAGAPDGGLDFAGAWHEIADLGAGELAVMAVAVLFGAVLAHPLQLSLVRVLEGAWPRWLGSGWARRRQLRRYRRLRRQAGLPVPGDGGAATPAEDRAMGSTMDGAGPPGPGAGVPDDPVRLQQMAWATVRLMRYFPERAEDVRGTVLGNALAAMEDRAGREYGLDAVVAWPRLYPLLRRHTRAMVSDRRNTLDLSARLSVLGAALTVATAVLLARSGWWLLLVTVPAAVAVTAYHGAVRAAVAYGEAVVVAFDLHRFDLLRAMHLPLPADIATERATNRALCAFWRQQAPVRFIYRHHSTVADLTPSRRADGATAACPEEQTMPRPEESMVLWRAEGGVARG